LQPKFLFALARQFGSIGRLVFFLLHHPPPQNLALSPSTLRASPPPNFLPIGHISSTPNKTPHPPLPPPTHHPNHPPPLFCSGPQLFFARLCVPLFFTISFFASPFFLGSAFPLIVYLNPTHPPPPPPPPTFPLTNPLCDSSVSAVYAPFQTHSTEIPRLILPYLSLVFRFLRPFFISAPTLYRTIRSIQKSCLLVHSCCPLFPPSRSFNHESSSAPARPSFFAVSPMVPIPVPFSPVLSSNGLVLFIELSVIGMPSFFLFIFARPYQTFIPSDSSECEIEG